MNQVRQIGRYRILSLIGSGSHALVYQAYDTKNDVEVALKVLRPHLVQNDEILRRFTQEAKAAAQLQDPHIIQVYDFGYDNRTGHYYITMAYVSGSTLETLLKERGVLSAREAVSLLSKIAESLHQAHQKISLIHRDIKPANILIDRLGNPILSDFGIARVHDNNLTKEGSTLGTPNYMSPEQAKGEFVTQASDIYSLGVVLYQAVTGQVPFSAPDSLAVMYQHAHDAPPRPRSINAAIPPRLEAVILKALEKKPQNRFASADEMAQEMQKSLIENRPLGKKSAKIIATGIALLLSVLFIGMIWYFSWARSGSEVNDGNGAVAEQPTMELTHTQEPTHTTLPGTATNTPPPTFTPPPELEFNPDFVSTAATPVPEEDLPTVTPSPTEKVAIITVEPTTAPEAPDVVIQTRQSPTEAPTQTPVPTPEVVTATQPPTATSVPTQVPVSPSAVPTEIPIIPTLTATEIPIPTLTATEIPIPTETATETPIPTLTATATAKPATATPVPPTPTPTFAGYNNAPQPLSPSGGEVINDEVVRLEWQWNGQPLQATDQFVLMGFRDSETLELGRVHGDQQSIEINMRQFRNFETDWHWYVRIEDQNGNAWPNTQSQQEHFGISLSK